MSVSYHSPTVMSIVLRSIVSRDTFKEATQDTSHYKRFPSMIFIVSYYLNRTSMLTRVGSVE